MVVKALDSRIMMAASKATTPEDTRALGLEEDENIIDLLAVLRQAFRHEIAHLKYHCDGVQEVNNDQQDYELCLSTSEICYWEAGYHADEKINELYFGNKTADERVMITCFRWRYNWLKRLY